MPYCAFARGLGNYLQVLSAESQLLCSAASMPSCRARALDLTVDLVQALGGGFVPQVLPDRHDFPPRRWRSASGPETHVTTEYDNAPPAQGNHQNNGNANRLLLGVTLGIPRHRHRLRGVLADGAALSSREHRTMPM